MAYDPSTNNTVLFGGYDPFTTGTFADTWVFHAGSWSQLMPSSSPSNRSGFVMAYDPAEHGVVLFGGEGPAGSGSYYNDTWVFSAGSWTQITTKTSPPARSQYAMAYDANDNEIVLFGGFNGGLLYDTWVFHSGNWHHVGTPTKMAAREYASAAYDAVDKEVVLAGGFSAGPGSLAGTWVFHGGFWSHVASSSGPKGYAQVMATTLANGTVLFFGGYFQNTFSSGWSNHSWVFKSGTWYRVAYAHPPSPRKAGGLVYDALDGYVLQFGGNNGSYAPNWLDDSWALY